jgi:ATP-dependent exoDNAse (exonuclease V) beta subunit
VTLLDAEARRRIAEDLDATFVVEAAAGTGKTSALVGRIVAVLRAGRATIPGILAVTFTEKAAGEMKLKLRAVLEEARAGAPGGEERQRLEAALRDLEGARVGTIHSLCADFLKQFPVEAGVDPRFEVAAEDEAGRLLDQAFESWLAAELEAPREGTRRALRRRPRGRRGEDRVARHLLRAAAGARVAHRDFPTPWRRDPFDRATALDGVYRQLEELGARLGVRPPGSDKLAQNLQRVRLACEEIARREQVAGRDLDALEADLHALRGEYWIWGGKGRWRFWGSQEAHAAIVNRRDAVKALLDDVCRRADADLAALLFEELGGVVDRYAALKASAGKLDFLDLLLACRDLVRGSAAARAAIARRVSHVFVDEFQDTDPVQAELLTLLGGQLFVVGDPKQSIYRFRRADLAFYQGIKARLVARGAEVLQLTASFRSVPAIQQAVNAAFAPRMTGGVGQAGYVPLTPDRPPIEGQPAVIALPAPRPYGKWQLRVESVEASYADAAAALVADLLARGFTVEENRARVRMAPRHVCLLFRRLQSLGNDTTLPYTRALEARGVPHVLVGGRSFYAREEVGALRAALAAVEHPDDALLVYAALRGPLFGVGDEDLLAYRAEHPLHPLHVSGAGPVAEALAALGELHVHRNHRPLADTVARLLEGGRAHVGLALWPGGEQALANVLRLADQARRFEAAGTTSFRAFVDWLDDEAAAGETGDAPVVEEGTEGVRIMSVHKAKGLEFPVVILCDGMAPRAIGKLGRLMDDERRLWLEPLAGCAPAELLDRADEARLREEEEGIRLAYVAATRARDLLVVPVAGDASLGGWLDVLDPAVQPRERRKPRSSAGFGGRQTVLERPMDAPAPLPEVVPGAHEPVAGAHEVVWWDPAALQLDLRPGSGVRREELLADGEAAEEGRRAYAAWRAAREETTAAASAPTLATVSARAIGLPPTSPVAVEQVEVDRPRPGGRRFGRLVHQALAVVPLGGQAAVAAVVEAEARQLGATAEEQAAARVAVARALAHPLLRRAAASGDVRRETPVLLRLPDGTIAEGTVDLAFREDGRWTVVDFKTDAELAGNLVAYQAQVGVYLAAVSAATGEPADGVLLVV